MKNLILSVAFILIATCSFGQSKGVSEVKFKTSAICGMCKQRIERDLGLTKGVESAELDLEDKVVTVRYKTKKTTVNDIQEAITMIGYDADKMIADQKAHDRLPGCCQKTAKPHKD
jgi:copper chaperone CopZ